MTRDDLEQLRALPAEIRSIEEAIRNLPIVTDRVTGSMTEHPYITQHYKIVGPSYDKLGSLLQRLEAKMADLHDRVAEMEAWLDGVEDSEIRTILRRYYVDGWTQERIGVELGYSRITITQKISRFFKKY